MSELKFNHSSEDFYESISISEEDIAEFLSKITIQGVLLNMLNNSLLVEHIEKLMDTPKNKRIVAAIVILYNSDLFSEYLISN